MAVTRFALSKCYLLTKIYKPQHTTPSYSFQNYSGTIKQFSINNFTNMNSSFLTLPLMADGRSDADIFANKAFESHDYDDSSSGYDSTDMSDVDSVTSVESCGITSDDSRHNFLSVDEKEEVMNFQSTHALCEHLKLILAMPEMCDVTFLVGPREVPVHGVRAIMGTRSRIMYQLLLKHMSMKAADEERNAKKNKKSKKSTSIGIGRTLSQRLVIPVKKYDSEVFRMLVQFIHCGSVNITEETVPGLFCAASYFELTDLCKACLDFVERCIQAGRAEKLLFSTRCYSHHRAASTLFEKIYSVLDKRYITKLEGTLV